MIPARGAASAVPIVRPDLRISLCARGRLADIVVNGSKRDGFGYCFLPSSRAIFISLGRKGLPNREGIMLTQSVIDGNVALAGPTFEWAGVSGTSRPASDVRTPLRLDLIARQDGICFACGAMLDGTAEFCHIVSRGPGGSSGGKGWKVGNIAVGHAACNLAQKENGPVVNLSDMARPDVVPMEWTPFPILRRSR